MKISNDAVLTIGMVFFVVAVVIAMILVNEIAGVYHVS